LAADLDTMNHFSDEQLARQRLALKEIADQRLEESSQGRTNPVRFAFRAAWLNRRELAEAILAARSWQFPIRLSRLTIASVSTLVILLLTAEAWDLGLSQSAGRLLTLT
jgi:hypothetical protein